MRDRKDLAMRNLRSFSIEFKRQVIQELLSGESSPAQLCRRHNIGSSLIYHWKRQYSRGKFDNEPTEEAALKDRVEKLERLVGKFTLENEFLKKGLQIVGLSSLLTFTMPKMPETINILKEAGLRDKVKVIVGGVPLNQSFAEQIGADAFARDAVEAVVKARELVNK